MKNAYIIFTRLPEPGKTKTRMMPYLTPEQCAQLHMAFLKDLAAEARKLKNCDIFVIYTSSQNNPACEDGAEVRLRTIFGEAIYLRQRGEDIGEKMYLALEEVFSRGYDKCILTGTDIPEITEEVLRDSLRRLDSNDVVFGLAEDGGYYLVGMKRPLPEVFGIESYGHSRVFQETIRHLESMNLDIGYTKTLDDIDCRQDLLEFCNRVRQVNRAELSSGYGSRSQEYIFENLRISVIIPVYNEEGTVGALMDQLRVIGDRCQIIFVDGGSSDRTKEIIGSEFKVIESQKGRAFQMNTGAEASDGDILWFLHSDSSIPVDSIDEIRRSARLCRAGCFGISFDEDSLLMRICARNSNKRVRKKGIMFGDQGIFVDRDLFFELGGFSGIPIMEDYDFSLKLIRRGIPIEMTEKRITTSARRFPRTTIGRLRMMLKMQRFQRMFRRGMDPGIIAERYRDIR